MCCRREATEKRIIFFSSRIFYGALCTSLFLPEGKTRALFPYIYVHIVSYSIRKLLVFSKGVPNPE